MDFFSGEFHISLMFVFRHFVFMLDSQSLRFIERIIINEEKKKPTAAHQNQRFLFRNKEVTNSTGNRRMRNSYSIHL